MSNSVKVLVGRLRRDTMILLIDVDGSVDMDKEAEKAIKEGRAQEAFVLAAESYYTASAVNWDPEGTNKLSGPSDVPPLNPGQGEQQSLDNPDTPTTTLRQEQQKVADESPKGVDTGSNPDGTPTGKARTQEELDEGKKGGEVPPSTSDKGPTKAPESSSAGPTKSPSLDKK